MQICRELFIEYSNLKQYATLSRVTRIYVAEYIYIYIYYIYILYIYIYIYREKEREREREREKC